MQILSKMQNQHVTGGAAIVGGISTGRTSFDFGEFGVVTMGAAGVGALIGALGAGSGRGLLLESMLIGAVTGGSIAAAGDAIYQLVMTKVL